MTEANRAILHHALDEAARLLRADGAMAYLFDETTGVLRFADDAGISDPALRSWVRSLKVEVGVGLFGAAVANGRTMLTGDYPADPGFVHFPDADRLVGSLEIRSFLVAPLVAAGRTYGALGTYTSRPDAFDENDVGLVRALADHAAAAIANADLIEALARSRAEVERRADAERALRQIGARITSLREPDEVLQLAVDEAARLLAADGARIDLISERDGALYWAFDATTGRLPGLGPIAGSGEAKAGEGISGRAIREMRPIFTGDYLADDRFEHASAPDEHVRRHAIRSVVAVPLLGDRGPLGTLTVYAGEADAFGEDAARFIEALAGQAAIAMTNARLIGDLERSRAELAARAETERSLRDIASRITSLGDPGDILARVVEESRRLLGSDGAHLTRLSEDGTFLVPVIVAGGMDSDTERWLKDMQLPLGGGINGLAAMEVQPISTSDYMADPRIPHEPEDDRAAVRLGLGGMAAAPLRAPGGEVIGTLAVSYAQPREILANELDLLQGLADQAAIALTNSNLYELLGESEGRYRHLVENSPDLVWSIDADGRFTFLSETVERLTGWRPVDLIANHFGALVHESSREVAEIDWTAGMVDESRELRGRVNLLHRDGHAVPAEFIAFGTLDETGAFAGANGSVRDMTERDRLERELRGSEERYRFLVENSPDVVFATDAEGKFSYLSETIERMVGLPPSDLVGGHFSRIVDENSLPSAFERWSALVAEPDREQVVRLQLRHADGHLVPVEVSAIGTSVDGQFVGIHGSTRDISFRERLERDLRRQAAELASSQERAHLARELHDSVTQALFSMTMITRSTELLIDRDVSGAKDKLGTLRELQREALAEMRALIFELRPGNLEQDGLLAALRTHTAALQGRIGLPVVVTSELSERMPLAVEEVLYRIAQEALHNIVKHAAARQAHVTLDRRPGGGVLLRIQDDGKGFDATRVPEGHLGLTGMRARAERIGATLGVESRLNEGTAIEVVVPEAAIARAGSGPAPAAPPTPLDGGSDTRRAGSGEPVSAE